MADNSDNSPILWFVAGAAIGASIAILYAPASGSETRKMIAKKTGEGRDALSGSGKDLLERGQQMVDRARELTDEAGEMFERGRKLVENTAANLNQG